MCHYFLALTSSSRGKFDLKNGKKVAKITTFGGAQWLGKFLFTVVLTYVVGNIDFYPQCKFDAFWDR